MSLRRVVWLAALGLAVVLGPSCGDIYRPVVLPVNINPPQPGNFHAVYSVNANVSFNPGSSMQIDVSGDSDIGAANVGVNPTHAAILPNFSRVFVASAGTLYAGDPDIVTAFTPAADISTGTGLGTPTVFTMPNVGSGPLATINTISESGNVVTVSLSSSLSNAIVGALISISSVSVSGYDGIFQISAVNGATIQYLDSVTGLAAATGGTATVPVNCSYLPDYVATAQNTQAFVANYGTENGLNCNVPSTDSVAAMNVASNGLTNIAYLGAGAHPVSMVETSDTVNLYVLNQGFNNVVDLSPADLTTMATIPLGNTPAWAALRPDNQRLYVVTQGDGMLYTISTVSNTVLATQSVGGPGANYVFYDATRSRLFVTNPTAGTVYIFSATTDPPTPITTLTIAAPPVANVPSNCGSYTCTYSSVAPTSVTALPDGSRFYVASYVTGTATLAGNSSTCPDPTVTTPGCVIGQISVYDAATLSLKTTIFPLIPPSGTTQPFAEPPVAYCAPVTPYTPSSARFRMSAAASVDSNRAYASLCDGGWVAIVATYPSATSTGINNTGDILSSDLDTPFSAAPPLANGLPALQYPIFLLPGQ
jgi:hypothetical protein